MKPGPEQRNQRQPNRKSQNVAQNSHSVVQQDRSRSPSVQRNQRPPNRKSQNIAQSSHSVVQQDRSRRPSEQINQRQPNRKSQNKAQSSRSVVQQQGRSPQQTKSPSRHPNTKSPRSSDDAIQFQLELAIKEADKHKNESKRNRRKKRSVSFSSSTSDLGHSSSPSTPRVINSDQSDHRQGSEQKKKGRKHKGHKRKGHRQKESESPGSRDSCDSRSCFPSEYLTHANLTEDDEVEYYNRLQSEQLQERSMLKSAEYEIYPDGEIDPGFFETQEEERKRKGLRYICVKALCWCLFPLCCLAVIVGSVSGAIYGFYIYIGAPLDRKTE